MKGIKYIVYKLSVGDRIVYLLLFRNKEVGGTLLQLRIYGCLSILIVYTQRKFHESCAELIKFFLVKISFNKLIYMPITETDRYFIFTNILYLFLNITRT